MKNINIKKDGNDLVIKIDLTKEFGPSKSSGKTIIVASTVGNHDLGNGYRLGVNCYKFPSE